MNKRKIGELTPGAQRRAIYRREDGRLYCLLNNQLHVEVAIEGGKYVGKGSAEEVDPEEVVNVIQDGAYAR